MSTPPERGRVRWRTFVRRTLLLVAILIVSYLVAANVFLRTRLLRHLVSDSSLSSTITGSSTGLQIDYASAYSILPGRAHVEGLTIRGREQTVEWSLIVNHADLSIRLIELFHRRFQAEHVRASGFSIRVRLRLERAKATPEVLAALPPIAGFPDPPLLGVGPPPPPAGASDHVWMIDLEDVDVEHVRDVWIHTVHSVGDTRVRGRWVFRPDRWLEVGPATVDTGGVDIAYGSKPLATGVNGSLDATVHPFDLRQASGLSIFDHVSTRGRLRGQAIVADVLRLVAPRSGLRPTRCEGPFDGEVVFDHGKLARGTGVWNDAADCEIEAGGLAFAAPIRAELGVSGDVATVEARVPGLRVSRVGAEMAHVASTVATVTTSRLRLADLFDDAHVDLDVVGAEARDIGAWERYVQPASPLLVRLGTVTADGHAAGSVAERRGRAELRLSVRRLALEHGSDRLTADVAADAQLREVSLSGGGWATGVATITASDMTARLGPVSLAGNLGAHVDLRRGDWAERTFDLGGSDVVLRRVSAGLRRDGGAVVAAPQLAAVAARLALAPSGATGHVSLDLPDAELPALGRLRELLPLPPALTIEAGAGRARLHAEVELGSGSMQSDGAIVARGVRARAGSTELFGDLDCTVKARRTQGAQGATDVSGSSLALTRAGTGSAPLSEGQWWANATLSEATLRTSGALQFDAKVHLSAKDASPATVLVSQNTGVPRWVANVFRMPALDADADVRLGPSSIEVGSLLARGGSTSLRVEYEKRSGRQDGAVLANLSWISLGYDLAEGASGLVLIGPNAWYARKAAGMHDAAEAARRGSDAAERLTRYAQKTPVQRKEEARGLAAQCTLDVRSCDGSSIESLLRAAADPDERDDLSGIAYAPMVVAAAKGGTDGTTLDPLVVDSVAEALRVGGELTLDNIPSAARAPGKSDAARGKVITVKGRVSPVRRDGSYSVGTMTTDAGPVYFVTPFATNVAPRAPARFRGVFVQRYAPKNESHREAPSLVLVGAFRR